MPICEVGRSGERKNPRGRRKKRKKAPAGRLGVGLKHHLGAKLGAKIYGTKLGAMIYGARIYGAELPAKSPPCLHRAQDLSASNDGAEKCNGAKLRVHILKSYLQGHIYKKFRQGVAVRHCSWLKIGFSNLRMKEELCSGKSESKCRCDLSTIPWSIYL